MKCYRNAGRRPWSGVLEAAWDIKMVQKAQGTYADILEKSTRAKKKKKNNTHGTEGFFFF